MRRDKKTVLLTGAGGNIGRKVVRMLAKRHSLYNIRVFDIDNPKNREFFDRFTNRIEVYLGDITDRSTLEKATSGVDVAIHLASIIPPMAYDHPDMAIRVNVGGTTNLIELLEQYSPDAHFIMASSVAIYGDRLLDPYIKVTDPIQPSDRDNYAETKIRMEELVKQSQLKWSIYRLSAIMGVGNHQIGRLMFRMPLEQIVEITTPTDTARAMVHSIDHLEEIKNRIFNLGGGAQCTTTYGELLAKNFEIFGLGALDFPSHAFATKNFHCGYYEDGHLLEDILHFRHDTLLSYYKRIEESTPRLQKLATRPLRGVIKNYLLSKSDPYKAWVEQDEEEMSYYFREFNE